MSTYIAQAEEFFDDKEIREFCKNYRMHYVRTYNPFNEPTCHMDGYYEPWEEEYFDEVFDKTNNAWKRKGKDISKIKGEAFMCFVYREFNNDNVIEESGVVNYIDVFFNTKISQEAKRHYIGGRL